MLTGFNTDVEREGLTYHVQTEDRGASKPLIESLVYVRGEILATRRTDYGSLVAAGAEAAAIQALMERQHRTIVDVIRSGRIDLLLQPPVGGASDTTVTGRSPLAGKGEGGPIDAARLSPKTLDEVIADWLAEQQHEERIRLRVLGGDDLTFGAPFALEVVIQLTPAETPVAGAKATARFLSTATKPVIVAEGTSGESGSVKLRGTVPALDKGQGLLVVAVQHPRGNDEVKFLIRR